MTDRYPKAKWLGQTPNNGGTFREGQPRFMVLHYTAGESGLSSAEAMMRAAWKASAPFVVDRDGSVLQISETDVVCWHAGVSKWKGISGLNKYSVGIEFANLGFMRRSGDLWMTGASNFKSPYRGGSQVVEAAHKNDPGRVQGWESYPEPQIVAGLELAKWLLQQFPTIEEIVGHDDISPGRKSDPGPVFPMKQFQGLLKGAVEPPDLEPADRLHVVSAGETLWSIARQYGTGVEDFLAANDQIKDADEIQPGQGLVVPENAKL